MIVQSDILKLKEKVITHRRWLHQHPEIGFELYKTKDYVLEQLSSLRFDSIEVLAQSGVKAVIKCKDSSSTIAFRADMDALSLKEETGLEFASLNDGLMHGCGHDGHTAILLGFAEWLSSHKEELAHNVVLIFQPAEESEGGALPMINEGVLDNPKVDAVFGLHIFPDVPQGKIGLRVGPIMAQTCEFNVEIKGKSAHGAMPHRGVDALLAACSFVQNVQSIITRRINPFEMALITIGKMKAGERRNILAEKVEMEGIIRTFNDGVYIKIRDCINDLLKGMEKSNGIESRFYEVVYYPVVNNDRHWTEKVEAILGKDRCIEIEPLMISEDFAYYQQRVPGVYLLLGSGNKNKGYVHPLHSNKFNFDEEILLYGVQLFTDVVKNV